jgi:CheY-like chemotaxis protein
MSKPLRILLIEDDAEDALLFTRRCPSGYQVQHATSGVSALETLRRGGIDICFTDYRLGPDNGLDIVRAARAEGLRVPIVVVTGQDLEALGENALLAGATDFVPKDGLDGAAISRLTRWSLIRRHVENQREDALSEEALAQLLGHAPKSQGAKSSSSDDSPGTLRRVLYLSQALQTPSAQELLIMCSGFAAANARTHVTGVLVCAGNRFMQVMEGEHTAIEVLLQRIRRDPRHSDMAVVLDEVVPTRIFSQWNMGSVHLHERYDSSSTNWLGLQEQVNRLLRADGITRDSVSQLIRGLPTLLGRTASVTG